MLDVHDAVAAAAVAQSRADLERQVWRRIPGPPSE
jgi:hypothetical protein